MLVTKPESPAYLGASGRPASRRLKAQTAFGMGIPTLLTILVVVLMTTFAVLALVSAKADRSLSTQAAAYDAAYYAADGQATAWLARLQQSLEKVPPQALQRKQALLGQGFDAGVMVKKGFLQIEHSWSIAGRSASELKVRIDYHDGNRFYRISSWRVVNAEEEV
ncbi:MAG: hypothetical protein LBL67_01335 [Coriobacteriales bacterium]|jgi:hypothetical protein|nr:hypothetical protein [Coriobacteriales bacterium]